VLLLPIERFIALILPVSHLSSQPAMYGIISHIIFLIFVDIGIVIVIPGTNLCQEGSAWCCFSLAS
jgi:hypothetical protein